MYKNLPGKDCDLCPRLKGFIDDNRLKFPDRYNAPVPSFGNHSAQLLIVGLAPGLKGANFTGRPFTGDYAGDLLYGTLLKFGLAKGQYGAHIHDGLELVNTRITNAVKCVPPQNKVTGVEINTCKQFLQTEIDEMRDLRVILTLGLVAHNTVLKTLQFKQSAFKFAHGARHNITDKVTLFNSYHCSRYNTNTGRLTAEMFEDVFNTIETYLR